MNFFVLTVFGKIHFFKSYKITNKNMRYHINN